MPDSDLSPEGWSSQDKFAAVLESASLNETELAEYCRKRGLYPDKLQHGGARASKPMTGTASRAGATRMPVRLSASV